VGIDIELISAFPRCVFRVSWKQEGGI